MNTNFLLMIRIGRTIDLSYLGDAIQHFNSRRNTLGTEFWSSWFNWPPTLLFKLIVSVGGNTKKIVDFFVIVSKQEIC